MQEGAQFLGSEFTQTRAPISSPASRCLETRSLCPEPTNFLLPPASHPFGGGYPPSAHRTDMQGRGSMRRRGAAQSVSGSEAWLSPWGGGSSSCKPAFPQHSCGLSAHVGPPVLSLCSCLLVHPPPLETAIGGVLGLDSPNTLLKFPQRQPWAYASPPRIKDKSGPAKGPERP